MAVSTEVSTVSVADEVWIAAALLHRELPDREDFSVQEIVARAEREGIHRPLRPGVYVHALQHCVANRPPNPGRYRMLWATGKSTRRLLRPTDEAHPARAGAKIVPSRPAIPSRYHVLLEWYEREYAPAYVPRHPLDALLDLSGLGKEVWTGVDPDAYVRQLREGWE
ncbi:MAG: hypothetical protein FJW14_05155 [Acidimicrobiia bacterium]|nr:hypothetical protein [Acidimicrobiia bacterium]